MDVTESADWTDGSGVPVSRTADLSQEVFAQFPFGLVVLDRSEGWLVWNAAARTLLGGPGMDDVTTCCPLVGCRRPGSALEHACLAELAEVASGPLPEVRIDLPDGRADAAWVTAAPLDPDGSKIIMQVRPGERNDRRRRTHPHWTSGPRLHVSTLGGTSVECGEGPITGEWLRHRHGQILKYLVCERGRVVPAEEIASAIWPDEGHERVLSTLRHYIHVLRETLEPGRAKRSESLFIRARKGGYCLDPDRVVVDADLFEERVRPGIDAFHEGDLPVASAELEAALEIYGGDFLADERYSEWVFAERERLQGLAGQACRILAELALREEDLDGAAAYIDRLVEIDYFDPDVQRALLALCIKRGRRSEAVRRYQAMRARIRREFGEEPTFTLSDVSQGLERPLQLMPQGAARASPRSFTISS